MSIASQYIVTETPTKQIETSTIAETPTEHIELYLPTQTCDQCGGKDNGHIDVYFGQGYGATLCPTCDENIRNLFKK